MAALVGQDFWTLQLVCASVLEDMWFGVACVLFFLGSSHLPWLMVILKYQSVSFDACFGCFLVDGVLVDGWFLLMVGCFQYPFAVTRYVNTIGSCRRKTSCEYPSSIMFTKGFKNLAPSPKSTSHVKRSWSNQCHTGWTNPSLLVYCWCLLAFDSLMRFSSWNYTALRS